MIRSVFSFDNKPQPVPRAVALGFFDGVHLGHRAVIHAMLAATPFSKLRPTVFTFDTLPKLADGLLLPREQTNDRLARMGVEECITADFAALCDLSPEAFVKEVLCGALHAEVVACGENFRFGKNAAGDAAALSALGEACGIRVLVVPTVPADGEPISSSRIRRAVKQGDMATAGRLLGAPYTLTAPVEAGRHLGRTLGTPTINQPLPPDCVLPAFGVYASAVVVDGRVTCGVTNIGVKPTVGGTQPLAETWIPDFAGDLYGQTVPVTPVKFLRPEQRFDSLEALGEQIRRDGEAARRLFDEPQGRRAILFDFDDTLQNRQEAFLRFSHRFLRRHVPQWTEDETARGAQRMYELNRGGNIDYAQYFVQLRAAFPELAHLDDEQISSETFGLFPFETTLLPDVPQALENLRKMGYRLGIVTNGRGYMQNRKLDQSGLRPLFDVVLVSGDTDVRKPDPEIFRRAAAFLGLPPADCVFVGDHPVNDIAGGLSAGMEPVFILASGFFRSAENDAVPVIRSIAELPALLGRPKG